MIYQILQWLFYGLIICIISVVYYYILLFLVNRKSRKELQNEWHNLNLFKRDIENYRKLSLEELQQKQLRYEQLRNLENERIAKINEKATENYFQAQEKMNEVEKIKQVAAEKIAKMENQISNLQTKLFNARERAKRLAKRDAKS